MTLLSARCFLLMLHTVASGAGAGRVKRFFVLVDMLDDPVLVQNEGRSPGSREIIHQNAVLFCDLTVKIAQQWKGYADLLGKCLVGG